MIFRKNMKVKDKISSLQRMIIVHSNIYYNKDKNIISDKKYDALSKLLVRQQNKYPKSFRHSQYYYCFKEFDGTTGFDLYDMLKRKDKRRIDIATELVLESYRRRRKRK